MAAPRAMHGPGNCIDLVGLNVVNVTAQLFEVDSSLVLCHGTPLLFARRPTAGAVPGADWDYPDTWHLPSGVGSIRLRRPLDIITPIHTVVYTTFDQPVGASMQLDPAHLLARIAYDDPSHWCASTSAWAGGDLGSPGEANAPCEDLDDDGFLTSEGDCDDLDPAINPDATELLARTSTRTAMVSMQGSESTTWRRATW